LIFVFILRLKNGAMIDYTVDTQMFTSCDNQL